MTVSAPFREDVETRFLRLLEDWKDRVKLLSNEKQMVLLRPYQNIIGMGLPAVPLLLRELERDPHWLFWALESITGTDPVPVEDRGNLAAMCNHWRAWGITEGFINS